MTAIVTALCFLGYFVGYVFYARFLARRVFSLDAARPTPAHTLTDGVDYVPTRPVVLFGHHWASITGLSPMLGPAVAVIWGWLPALLWVVLGAIFVGCVHDFGALVVSVRAKGLSIGKVTEGIIGARAKTLFHLIIFFGIALAMGVFVYVISVLFSITDKWQPIQPLADPSSFPTAVLPSAVLIVLAMIAGFLLYRRHFPLLPTTAVAFVLILVGVWGGLKLPLLGLARASWPQQSAWIVILLVYSWFASVLPVWSLLQARDFLNSLLLYLGLILAYAGLFIGAPSFAAPAFRPHPAGAPSFFPFVFIIIACGAASGFHSLVASGTTAKQLDREPDARPIGYGGMIGESLLGLLAILATTAGIGGHGGESAAQVWRSTYASWGSMQGLGKQVGVFITGAAHFIQRLGFVDHQTAVAFVAVVVVSFALTTLDSATRLLRFNISEIGETLGWKWLDNRFPASTLAVAAIAFFAFFRIGGKPAGLALWRLFGTTNQLLAGLALLVVTLYLKQRGRNPYFTGIPMIFMLVTTLTAMVINLRDFWRQPASGGMMLFIVGLVLLVLALWLVFEAIVLTLKSGPGDRNRPLEVIFPSEHAADEGGASV
ncbi:MAG TPA: carbon starvation CstA family protein [Thermoanaerobaculia bacterium]|nr:carbon starvation CstA family protein [Thermoanaerobaculia bacterium]